MATASGTIGINIQFGKQRATLHVDKKTKLNAIIAKALKELKEEPQGRHFLLLHEGKALPGDATAEAVFISKSATVFFLQPATELQVKTASQIQLDLKGANNTVEDNKYGYCKTCGSVCEVKPIFKCAGCNQETFILDGDVDFFDDESVLKAKGTCANTSCKEKGQGRPRITYVCKACPGDNPAPFLKQLRSNIHQLPCMKCEKKDIVVFQFSCNSKHTICFNCFHYYCTIMLDRSKFKNFELAGFSIHCPGTDADCLDTPISDPHHFRIVEKTTDGKSFYNAFSDLAMKQWVPPGDNIICTKENCNFEVDMSRGTDTQVTQPVSAATPVVTGSAWMFFKKIFQGPPPPPPPPQMRKKVSCFKCQQAYCCVCKKNWHEGDCVIVDEKEVKEFTIDPKCAAASKWPQ